MAILKRMGFFIVVVIVAATVFTACSQCSVNGRNNNNGVVVLTSFRDIPGITNEDIEAIEALQRSRTSFVYGANYSTEAFSGEDGVVRGFTALFCEWLTQLFEIPFIPQIFEWDELVEGLENHSIDFSGELTANEERRKKYFMTDDIVQRRIIYVRLDNTHTLSEISQTRPLRLAFLDGTTTIDDVRGHKTKDFEVFLVDDYPEAYELLRSGAIDAFFDESPAEAAFDVYGKVFVNT
ncbi:MAG: transporter substrate-binding domain-containing protein, partial [Chitinivibrionia bacterium]|nr:transporter substrate-binding domain-containing protein [Chitinivibrionia bacterium]